LRDALAEWRAGRLEASEQDPARVTLAPLVTKRDGVIEWSKPAVEIERAVRAFTPWPGATTSRSGTQLRVWSADALARELGEAAPGPVLSVDRSGVSIAAGGGVLRLVEVQAAGKKRMPAPEWARGARLANGERLGESRPP